MKTEEGKPRRVRGSGSLYRKANSRTWCIQYYREGFKKDTEGNTVLDAHGNPIRARIKEQESTGTANQRKAQDMLNERLAQVSRGEWAERPKRPVTIEELVTDLKKHYLANGNGDSGSSINRRWAHLQKPFAGVLAANLTTDAVRDYSLRRQREGAANATINRELATLRRALNLGRRCTPAKVKVTPYIPMLKENNVRRGFVEDADFARLRFVAEGSELWMRVFLELAFTYGWRKGELLGLRVRQVNFATSTIRLDAGTTKNLEGREVAMTARVAELLRVAVKAKKPDDYVLTREGNRRVKEFRKAWHNLCVLAGLGRWLCASCGVALEQEAKAKAFKPCACGARKKKYDGLIVHDFRRSAAKALRRAGVAESIIMATGGWKTAAMFRRYAIVSSADQRAAVEALERAREQNDYRSTTFSENTTPEPPKALTEKLQ